MRNETDQRRPNRQRKSRLDSRSTSAIGDGDFVRRSCIRLVEQTSDLSWSSRLITLLLERTAHQRRVLSTWSIPPCTSRSVRLPAARRHRRCSFVTAGVRRTWREPPGGSGCHPPRRTRITRTHCSTSIPRRRNRHAARQARRLRRGDGLTPLKGNANVADILSLRQPTRGHRVRELVCAYRPLRDPKDKSSSVPTLVLSHPTDRGGHARRPCWRTSRSKCSPSRASRPSIAFSLGTCSRAAPAPAHPSRCQTSSCLRVSRRARRR